MARIVVRACWPSIVRLRRVGVHETAIRQTVKSSMKSRWNRVGCSLPLKTWRQLRSKARPAARELQLEPPSRRP